MTSAHVENPFVEGENRVLRPPATAIVIFGATGDLTHRKLLPALYNLAFDDHLPGRFAIIGASRTKWSDQDFREKTKASLEKFSRRSVKGEIWDRFSENLFFHPLDGTKEEDFDSLSSRISSLEEEFGEVMNCLFYLATSPKFFAPICRNLDRVGLGKDRAEGIHSSSVVLEKPFGFDLASAKELNDQLGKYFDESQVYRIDHYLGKETVQNILVFRFANGIFEPLWNRQHIDSIQITVSETVGVGSRAGYFDQTGILRDIVQNHLLQLLALLCIEPPLSLSSPDSIRDEKVKVLESLVPFTPESLPLATLRGQYRGGFVNGEEVKAYTDEEGIDPNSTTETYAALRLAIDNWRWAGVPIYVRAGKRLPKRITEISLYFKKVPEAMFRGRQIQQIDPSVLSIQVQPQEGISFFINSKPPGPRLRVNSVKMDFLYDDSFAISSPEAYERLLLDAMKGDPTLFIRNDEIEEAWSFLEPVLEYWKKGSQAALHHYPSGQWGPVAADELLLSPDHRWRAL